MESEIGSDRLPIHTGLHFDFQHDKISVQEAVGKVFIMLLDAV